VSEPSYIAMHNGSLERVLSISRHYFLERRHTALLVAIVAAFATRPLFGDNKATHVAFSATMLVLLLIAIYTIQIDELIGERGALLAERRRLGIIGWVLFAVATCERLATIIAPSPLLYQVGSISWLVFCSFITWNELRAVLRQKVVTGETISMSISVYLLTGLTFAFVYIFIYECQPHAFNFPSQTIPNAAVSSDPQSSILPVLVYFSLTTLTTIGYGDITPLSLQARFVAVAEGVTGQFYIAILVARLVAMQMTGSASREAQNRSEDL
jgi:hypothetical protein